MTSMTGTARLVVSAVVLAVAAVVVILVLAFRPSSTAMAGMAGMDHGSGTTSTSAPAAARSDTPDEMAGMAGMDHGAPVSGHEYPATDHHAPGTGHDSGDVPKMDLPASSPKPTMAEEMPGMDHGTGHTPQSTPTPPMAEDMPGMDHGTGEAAEPGHGTGHTPESGHGTADSAETDPDRPLAPVLGAFGGGTSAVLLTAGLLRRRDRAADQVKQAARAARRSQK